MADNNSSEISVPIALRPLILVMRITHLGVLLFVIFGWTVPIRGVLWAHSIFVPLMVLQWRVNDGTCWLTNLEYALLGAKAKRHEQQGQFIKGLLRICCDPLPEDRVIKRYLYGVLWGSWVITVARLGLTSLPD